MQSGFIWALLFHHFHHPLPPLRDADVRSSQAVFEKGWCLALVFPAACSVGLLLFVRMLHSAFWDAEAWLPRFHCLTFVF
jgi:hypothetical protein